MDGEGCKMERRGESQRQSNRTNFTCIFSSVNHVKIVHFDEKP